MFKFLSAISILIAIYLAFNSINYAWTVYNSLYQQVGLAKTIISFFITIEIALIGIGLLFMPLYNLLGNETSTKKMLFSNFFALIASVLLVELAFPAWIGFITILLLKFF